MSIAVLDSITKVINSPPGQLVAGGVLFGIVYKLFQMSENVLSDTTKLEIAVWLLDKEDATRSVRQASARWPSVFQRIFEGIFGQRHFSLKCLIRSTVASVLLTTICMFAASLVLVTSAPETAHFTPAVWGIFLVSSAFALAGYVVPDYFSLLGARLIIRGLQRHNSIAFLAIAVCLSLIIPLYLSAISLSSGAVAALNIGVWLLKKAPSHQSAQLVVGAENTLAHFHLRQALPFTLLLPLTPSYWSAMFNFMLRNRAALFFLVPGFGPSIWLWLYAGSGLMVKAVLRFNIGFDWFNRKFDIEKKPLQSIGLVAGALVAVVYWAVVGIGHLVG